VRAGVDPLPPQILATASRERELEQMIDEGLFGREEPGAAITGVRHFIARQLVRRLAAPDDGAPLWPRDVIAPEPYNVSWQRFFDIAWPALERAQLLDVLHARVATRASDDDRRFAKYLLLQDALRGDPRGPALGDALEQAGFPENELANVRQLARIGRIQLGWQLLQDKRFVEARRVADAALADAPKDGQVRFFDARLAWLERDDPEVALPRITAALDVATDDVGRARLFNLYGAALDALGRAAESIAWFERALAADPSQAAMLLSNIAEAHWKLGDRAQAHRFAEQATRRGATTAIVTEILEAMGEDDE